jgi:phytanoyl-CoA dioxygenase PhyH
MSLQATLKGPLRRARDVLRTVDQGLGFPLTGRLEAQRTQRRQAQFARDLEVRRQKYAASSFTVQPHREVVAALNADGCTIVRNAMQPALLLDIKRELEHYLDTGTCLNPVSRDAARTPGDRGLPTAFLTPEELAKGQVHYRQQTNYAMVAEPFFNCPSVVPVAFADLLIDIATAYLGCPPAIGGGNLRKSFASGLPEFDTLFFHTDPNSPKFVKFFFYLNDVDETGGPFCYVRGSHRQRFKGWSSKVRWTPEEIVAQYGADRIVLLTAKVGDMLLADTNGFHRGTKVRSTDRSMLTVDYVIHPEFDGQHENFKIRAAEYERLSAKQRAATDFLTVA